MDHSSPAARSNRAVEPSARKPLGRPIPPAYTPADIASLRQQQIESMTNQELVEAIRSVRGGHLRRDVNVRLPLLDRPTLERLMFLTQRYCRLLGY